jgi:hypothetical protein
MRQSSSIHLFVLATSFSMNAAEACKQTLFVIVGSNRCGIIKLMLIRSENEQQTIGRHDMSLSADCCYGVSCGAAICSV